MIVRESLINENKKDIELSAGLAVIQNGTILLVHPKDSEWWGTFSIPKGHIEEGEKPIDAAIRETQEEIGLTISKHEIKAFVPGVRNYVDFKNEKGEVYKRVYFFVAMPDEKVTTEMLIPDKVEIDWGGFLNKEKAAQRINPKLISILDLIEDENGDYKDNNIENSEEDLDLGI